MCSIYGSINSFITVRVFSHLFVSPLAHPLFFDVIRTAQKRASINKILSWKFIIYFFHINLLCIRMPMRVCDPLIVATIISLIFYGILAPGPLTHEPIYTARSKEKINHPCRPLLLHFIVYNQHCHKKHFIYIELLWTKNIHTFTQTRTHTILGFALVPP